MRYVIALVDSESYYFRGAMLDAGWVYKALSNLNKLAGDLHEHTASVA